MCMVPSESARVALYSRLEEVLGPQHAETLMTSLPMESAARLATRDDIVRLEDRFDRLEDRFDRLEVRLEGRIDALAGEVRGLQGAMREQLRTYTVTTVGAMTALTGIYAALLTTIS
jgi:hypothetical protein